MKIICISDTHGLHNQVFIPDGDMIIHSGDFCSYGTEGELKRFRHWFRALPHKHKILVAGNHDWPLDCVSMDRRGSTIARVHALESYFKKDGITYLMDSGIEVDGFYIWGSPWQPFFCNWAFQLSHEMDLKRKWEKIPLKTDILVTHGPPFGVLDRNESDKEDTRRGCNQLRMRVDYVKPKLHVFGHIHEGYGAKGMGETVFVNAATCNLQYKPINPPVVCEIGKDEIDVQWNLGKTIIGRIGA